MSPRSTPPLTPREVKRILTARGFIFSHSRSSHHNYKCKRNGKTYTVTVDVGIREFDDNLIKSMIRQSGMSKQDFYCSTKKTARKIDKRVVSKEKLTAWLATVE